MNESRRRFLRSLGMISGALTVGTLSSCKQSSQGKSGTTSRQPERPSGSIYMGGFKAAKLEAVKLAFIGLSRGFTQLSSSCVMPGTEIVGVCDLHPDLVERSISEVSHKTGKAPKGYGREEVDYRNMLKECTPDAVIISTDWASHVPVACDCMEMGAHVFIEVPFSSSLDEIWQLVETSEKTRKHCMMMENVNYGREELMFLNMVRQGVIGDLTHGEAAYIHNLRDQLLYPARGEGNWRPDYLTRVNGNLYPTHGLGPVAQYMNLARREDTFDRLVSFSSPSLGCAEYARRHLKPDDKWSHAKFICGDINNSIIKTVMGRTVLVQWDEATPRPYSRLNLIQGTLGALAGFPTRVAGENLGNGNYHEWIQDEGLAAIYEKYEHPLWRRLGDQAQKLGGHGGMDFIMMYRIIECLRNGEPMDQNVYEGAFWSAVGPLSVQSVAEGGMPVPFPDFTRGEWKNTEPLPVIA